MKHIDEEHLIPLGDRELTENDAAAAREHARECSVCRERIALHERVVAAIRAPVRTASPVDELVGNVMDRIEARQDSITDAPSQRLRYVGAAVLAMSVAAAIAFVVHTRGEAEYIAARSGGAEAGLARDVGVTVVRVEGGKPSSVSDVDVTADSAYAVVVRNAGRQPAHALVFAVDAADAVHWVAPVYLDAEVDPTSVVIAPSVVAELRGPAVVLDHPAPGPLRFVAIVTPRPLRVSQIELLRPPDLQTTQLRTRFPEADVRDLALVRVHSRQEPDR